MHAVLLSGAGDAGRLAGPLASALDGSGPAILPLDADIVARGDGDPPPAHDSRALVIDERVRLTRPDRAEPRLARRLTVPIERQLTFQ